MNCNKKNGNNAIANTLIKKRDNEARRLIAAFNKYYDYSPVYFFFSHDVKKLKLGLKTGFFLNENLEVDNSIVLEESEYLIFDKVIPREEDIPIMYLDNAWGRREDESKRNKNKKTHGTDVFTHSSSGVATYVIKNSAFEQLRPPFPVYTKRKMLRGLLMKSTFLTLAFIGYSVI